MNKFITLTQITEPGMNPIELTLAIDSIQRMYKNFDNDDLEEIGTEIFLKEDSQQPYTTTIIVKEKKDEILKTIESLY